MRTLFADSFYFIALTNRRDAAHERATAFAAGFAGKLVTTHWVLTEFADALSAPATRDGAGKLIDFAMSDSRIRVEPASAKWFAIGYRLYRERPDKGWSLTDCISFEVMKARRVTEALTGDAHFEQAGFRAVLR